MIMDRAAELRRLHTDPDLLILVNVWDVASAVTVAGLPGCRAIATASHSIAASLGYPDGENLPFGLMLDAVARICAAVQLPETADLEAGYGDIDRTIRAAVGAGVVGANLEDQLRPLGEAVAGVEAAVQAAAAEGADFVLNARTDAFLLAGAGADPAAVLADALERGRAYLDAGADCVFAPGAVDFDVIAGLVSGLGRGRVSLLGLPGLPSVAELTELGVARLSYGPYPHRVALAALAETGTALLAGAGR